MAQVVSVHAAPCGKKDPNSPAHNANGLHLSPRVDRIRPLSETFDTSFSAGEVWAGCGPSLPRAALSRVARVETLSGRADSRVEQILGSRRFSGRACRDPHRLTRPVLMTDTLTAWMTAYRDAWQSNVPADIRALFTEDAVFYKEPFNEPLRGHEAIVAMWLKHQDGTFTSTFGWKPLSVTDDLSFIQGETDYGSVKYSNLWVIRLAADGRATEFTEWWMDQSKPS